MLVCSVLIISRLDSQSKFQMFTLFSGRHIGVPWRYTLNMAFSYWALWISAKYFDEYLKFGGAHVGFYDIKIFSFFHWMVFDLFFSLWQWKRSIAGEASCTMVRTHVTRLKTAVTIKWQESRLQNSRFRTFSDRLAFAYWRSPAFAKNTTVLQSNRNQKLIINTLTDAISVHHLPRMISQDLEEHRVQHKSPSRILCLSFDMLLWLWITVPSKLTNDLNGKPTFCPFIVILQRCK